MVDQTTGEIIPSSGKPGRPRKKEDPPGQAHPASDFEPMYEALKKRYEALEKKNLALEQELAALKKEKAAAVRTVGGAKKLPESLL